MKLLNLIRKGILVLFVFSLVLALTMPNLCFAWEHVNTDGFGDAANTDARSMCVFNGCIYAGTCNAGGLEIWRSCNETSWEMVVGDPLPYPRSNGFGDSGNTCATSMVVYDDYLYVGTKNSSTGCKIWRSSDGNTWTQVNIDGFASINNIDVLSMVSFNNYLFVATDDGNAQCQVWRTSAQGSLPFNDWVLVINPGWGDSHNRGAYSMAVFNNKLHVGTRWVHITWGACNIWSTSGQGDPPFIDWAMVNNYGFGDEGNTIAYSMLAFNNELYVGTSHAGGCEIWSSAGQGGPPHTDWQQRNTPGFGDANNDNVSSMTKDESHLYVGTLNSNGCEVWRYYYTTSWSQINDTGFGDANNINASSMVFFNNNLYVGTQNNNGCEIWADIPDIDSDNDGIYDALDNCPGIPNGPTQGICTSGEIVVGNYVCNKIGQLCKNSSECGTNGFCSMAQEDTDGDGIGDACDSEMQCNGNFDCDGDVDGTDALRFKLNFGRKNCPNCPTTCLE